MRALVIEWEPHSGKRAAGINPKDPKLQCHGWQCMESDPAIEIRLVEDDRDLSIYESCDDVQILEGKETINAAIEKYILPKYHLVDMGLLLAAMKEHNCSCDEVCNMTIPEIAKWAYEHKLAGATIVLPKLIK